MSAFQEFQGTIEQLIDDEVERHQREIKLEADAAWQELLGKIAFDNRSIGQQRRFENQRKFTGATK
jgi:putative alpha-1,2-mannosidase